MFDGEETSNEQNTVGETDVHPSDFPQNAEEEKAATEAAVTAIRNVRTAAANAEAPAKTPLPQSTFPAPKPPAKPAPAAEPDTLAKLRSDFETFKKKVQKHVSYT